MKTRRHPALDTEDMELDGIDGLVVQHATSLIDEGFFEVLDYALSKHGLELVMLDAGTDCYHFVIEKRV